jgi:hypothetical protein
LVATWDGRAAKLFIDGQQVAADDFDVDVTPPRCPIRLGASGAEGRATQFLDGDLAAPAIYVRALSDAEIVKRFKAAGLSPPDSAGLVAYWPLDEERGTTVRDAASENHTGAIVNRGTWMIGGPSFDGAAVTRYGEYNPDADPQRGHGLRLAADDLYDCRWEVDHEFVVPEDAAPGIYVAEAEFERKSKTFRYPITFMVRRSPNRPAADMLVLCATSTWTAYSATPFAMNTSGPQMWGTGGIIATRPRRHILVIEITARGSRRIRSGSICRGPRRGRMYGTARPKWDTAISCGPSAICTAGCERRGTILMWQRTTTCIASRRCSTGERSSSSMDTASIGRAKRMRRLMRT